MVPQVEFLGWEGVEMAEYDAIVIGAGTGGESVMKPLHTAGLKVAAIEQELVLLI